MGSLLSGARTSGDITQQIQTVFMEAQYAGNVIIVIDNFHHYVSSGAQEATANITPIIMPYLKSPNFQLIGICDNTGYRRYVEPNKDLFSQFEEVKVAETTPEETFLILQNVLPMYERMYHMVVTIGALREVISLSELYMPNVAFPEKAINLLSEICVFASDSHIRHILPMMVADYIAKKVQAPVGEMKEAERDRLVHLETFLHQRVIGQEEAISVISDAMRRARTGVGRKKKPIGTFLFLGPTGVGKTETAKALAESYFGSEDRIVRFDMSEYSEATALDILIGSEAGNNPGHLATRVKENPFSVVLFDEIEKAHRTVHDLFLQVLDEGYCTDAFGQKISFLSSIIIATSNAGAIQLRDMVKQNLDRTKIKSLIIDVVIKEGIFRPEFLNRFDATVVFDILTKENIVKITDLMFKRLAKRLEDKGYFFSYTKEVVEKLSDIGFDPVFGGRAIARAMQEKIEGKIALDILSGKYKPGDTVEIRAQDFA
jgi:ATP-dependent Clp protease ATP-binding subunit ClpC